MDELEKYVINHSSCAMPRCEYVENGTDIDCDECQKIMLAEHDAKVRAEAIDDVDNIITEQLDKSDNQVECQTLRWVLDVLSDLIK